MLLPGLPDWRDAGAYTPIVAGGPLALAWELLRRDPEYRAAAAAVRGENAGAGFEATWGLRFPG